VDLSIRSFRYNASLEQVQVGLAGNLGHGLFEIAIHFTFWVGEWPARDIRQTALLEAQQILRTAAATSQPLLVPPNQSRCGCMRGRHFQRRGAMTEFAREFLDKWVKEHIASLTHDTDDTEARASARMCVADAEQQGISQAALEDAAAGDLVAFMAGTIRNAVRKQEKRASDNGKAQSR
jgi:hypothetical protein